MFELGPQMQALLQNVSERLGFGYRLTFGMCVTIICIMALLVLNVQQWNKLPLYNLQGRTLFQTFLCSQSQENLQILAHGRNIREQVIL